MRRITGRFAAAAALVAIFFATDAAFAKMPTPFQQAELAQLSPTVRSQVEARMTGKQTVRGIVETMLLNNIAKLFAAKRVVAVDFEIGVATVEGKDGSIRTFPFEIPTLIIRK
jgi:hypothetical protein